MKKLVFSSALMSFLFLFSLVGKATISDHLIVEGKVKKIFYAKIKGRKRKVIEIKTKTGPARVPASSIPKYYKIVPGKIIRSALTIEELLEYNKPFILQKKTHHRRKRKK